MSCAFMKYISAISDISLPVFLTFTLLLFHNNGIHFGERFKAFMKKISIIIPCYNAAEYINQCILSLTRQTIGVDHLEIIAVNDASTDNTKTIINDYASRYPDIIKKPMTPIDPYAERRSEQNTVP